MLPRRYQAADAGNGDHDNRHSQSANVRPPLRGILKKPNGQHPQGPNVAVNAVGNTDNQPRRIPQRPGGRDVHSLLTRIGIILNSPIEYRELLNQQGELCQSLLDLLQALYDHPDVLPRLRSKILRAIIHLSKNSGLYPNCLSLDNVQKIGEHPVAAGGFGEIWKGLIGGQIACLKVVKIYGDSDVQKLLKEFLKEAILWRQLNHPNVLPFLGLYFLDTSKQRVCLISPWMKNGNLRQYINNHGLARIDGVVLAFDIACGLSYLHEKKVIHGDLKGDNILITDMGRAAIADFGLARKVSESDTLKLTSLSTSNHAKGSTRWMAPECLLEAEMHTYSSDIYAFGCVCYEIFTGKVPFYELSREPAIVIQLTQGKRPTRPRDKEPNDKIWAFLQECWTQDPSLRPPANALSSRVMAAANRRSIDRGGNWDNDLSVQLRRSIQHPDMCPRGSDLEVFLFGRIPVGDDSPSVTSSDEDLFTDPLLSGPPSLLQIRTLEQASTRPSPSAEYLSQLLSDNPLGLMNMIPREQLYGPGKDGALPETPAIWNPRGLRDQGDEGDYESTSESDSSHSSHQRHAPRRLANQGIAGPTPVAVQAFTPMQVTFSPRIVRTPDHYRNMPSPGARGSSSRIRSSTKTSMGDMTITTATEEPLELLSPLVVDAPLVKKRSAPNYIRKRTGKAHDAHLPLNDPSSISSSHPPTVDTPGDLKKKRRENSRKTAATQLTLPPESAPKPLDLPRVRKGFWNRRGDHYINGYIVYAPLQRLYPYELEAYPKEYEGYMNEHRNFVPFRTGLLELPDSKPNRESPPVKPYDSFVHYVDEQH